MEVAPQTCPSCGRIIDRSAVEGLCAGCLVRSVLQESSWEEDSDLKGLGESESGLEAAFVIPTPPQESFGDYSQLRPIARGGMGVVYEARQNSLNRKVALKMILAGRLAHDTDIARFKAEAEAAGNLDHPNIVPIYEVGEKDGQPFFSMKLIEGGNLAQWFQQHPRELRSAARILAKVATAIHFAHEHGILHRDLKPANILLDSQTEPHITDFGLAKCAGRDAQLTITNVVLGTPAYLAPELAAGGSKNSSTSADIYSLGAILYEAMTGRPPFQGDTALETLHQVIRDDPPRPSTLNPRVDRDLETVCLKCLEKDPVHRYRSAEDLASDLNRWLEHRPIQARPSAPLEVVLKWARRRPLAATLVVTIVLFTLALLGISTALGLRIAKEAQRNRDELTRLNVAEGTRLAAEGDFALALLHFTEALRLDGTSPDRALANRQRLGVTLRQAPVLEQLWFHQGPVNCASFSPMGQLVASASSDATARVWDVASGHAATPPLVHPASVTTAFFSPDGTRLATTCADQTARLWDVAKGTMIGSPFPENDPKFHRIETPGVNFSHDGSRLVSAQGKTAQVRDARDGSLVGPPLEHSGRISHVTFSPSGEHLLLVGGNGEARLVEAVSGKSVWTSWKLQSGAEEDWASGWFTPDGKVVLIATHGGEARLWDTETGKPRSEVLHHDTRAVFTSAGFGQGGAFAFTAGIDARIRMWDSTTGRSYGPPLESDPEQMVEGFTAGGSFIHIPMGSSTLRIRRLGDGRRVWPALQHSDFILSAQFNPDKTRVVTADRAGIVRVWSWQQDWSEHPSLTGRMVTRAEFSPDGHLLASASASGLATLVDVPSGREKMRWTGVTSELLHAAFSSQGDQIATGFRSGDARIWDLRLGKERVPALHHGAGVRRVAFNPDGSKLLTITLSKDPQLSAATVWDAQNGSRLVGPILHPDWLDWCEFSPDGKSFLTACADGHVRLFETATGRPLVKPMFCGGFIWEARFSPDGKRLVAASTDYTYEARSAFIFEVATGKQWTELKGHRDGVTQACFSPDGKKVATGSEDATVRLWDASSGRPLLEPLRPGGKIQRIVFSPDGRLLAAVGTDAGVWVWEVMSGKPICPPLPHDRAVKSLRFAPDSNHLLTTGDDGVPHVWDLSPIAEDLAKMDARAVLFSSHRKPWGSPVIPLTREEIQDRWEHRPQDPHSPSSAR